MILYVYTYLLILDNTYALLIKYLFKKNVNEMLF